MPIGPRAPRVTLTEGSIRVLSLDRTLTILPASSVRPEPGEAGVDFVVDLDEILAWDPPHQSVEIEVPELLQIVQAIETEFARLGLVVEFD